MSGFTHLHTHTEYSLLDGAGRVKDIIARAAELNMNSIAITDHGAMYGVIDFYKQAKSAGIKPIIGCEVYVAQGSRLERGLVAKEYAHLVLLAKNEQGYTNLMKLVSEGFLTGFYYKPRIDYALLEEHCEGLVCLSACLAGDVQRLLSANDYTGAKRMAERLRSIFEDDFYLEIQDHGIAEQRRINPLILKLSSETGIKLVATNDVHYVNREDSLAQDVMMCIGTATTMDEPGRMAFETDEFYLKSEQEMRTLFENVPQAVDNTIEVAKKCNLEIEFGSYHLPHFELPDGGYNNIEYLKNIAEAGLKKRYGSITANIASRFGFELDTINQMGFTDYFLIVWDFVRYAKQSGIMVGPGRGSAAGSIVAYALGITNIDPIRYNLLFERFLNPERISMPDIDIDFCYERRQEVIDYVGEKYGEDRVAQIITFGTMGARLVLRDVARVLNMSISDADRLAKMVPFELKMTIDKALERNEKMRQEYENNDMAKRVIDISRRLEGMPRHASTHAAGVVISKNPITEYVPLQKNNKDDSITTQYPMKQLEDLGLLKMDFLGLRTLTVIRDAVALAEQNHGAKIDIDEINIEDKSVYELIASGETEGMFQLESGGMRRLMQDLKPSNLDEIMVGISLFRPGPMDSIPEYLRCKRSAGGVRYAHKLLEPILKDTYGCMVYQEQIMRIVRDVAGYSLARSDLVRRAMSKKQHAVLEKERRLFIYGGEEDGLKIDGAVARGVSEKIATELFDQMMAFANYAFNKSHACAYAVVAYQTAWLKKYYPVEFMTALLNSFISHKPKLAEYIGHLKRTNIKVLPPNINKSQMRFSTENGGIRFGLAAIAYVGEAIDEVIARRKSGYRDFFDFVEKNADVLNKKRLESLILCGCFDCFGAKRAQLMEIYSEVLVEAAAVGKRQASGQISLFDSAEEEFVMLKSELPNLPEYGTEQLLSFEKEMIGLYVSGHPLDDLAAIIEKRKCNVVDIMRTADDDATMYEFDGKKVELLGIVSGLKLRSTKQKKPMANLTLEDLYSQISVIVFPHVFSQCESFLRQDAVVQISGKVTVNAQSGIELLAESVRQYTPEDSSFAGKQLFVKVPIGREKEELFRIAARHKGSSGVVVYIEQTKQKYMLGGAHSVCYSDELIAELKSFFGDENIILK